MHVAEELALVVGQCRELPPAEGIYLEDDFVTNLLATVVDFQMNTTAVVRAIEHYKAHRWDEVRTMDAQVPNGLRSDRYMTFPLVTASVWSFPSLRPQAQRQGFATRRLPVPANVETQARATRVSPPR